MDELVKSNKNGNATNYTAGTVSVPVQAVPKQSKAEKEAKQEVGKPTTEQTKKNVSVPVSVDVDKTKSNTENKTAGFNPYDNVQAVGKILISLDILDKIASSMAGVDFDKVDECDKIIRESLKTITGGEITTLPGTNMAIIEEKTYQYVLDNLTDKEVCALARAGFLNLKDIRELRNVFPGVWDKLEKGRVLKSHGYKLQSLPSLLSTKLAKLRAYNDRGKPLDSLSGLFARKLTAILGKSKAKEFLALVNDKMEEMD